MINLLFVDDEQSVLDALRRTLRPRRREWNVSFATGGKQALDLLSQSTFHGIVTDMRMPGMDGLTLLTQVANLYPDLLRVVLSGQSEIEAIAKSDGITHHYLAKPCPVEILGATINRAFSLQRLFAEPALVDLVSGIEWDQPNTLRDASRQDLAALLLKRPEWLGRLLSVAQRCGILKNRTEVDALGLIQILGITTVKCLLMSAALCGSLDDLARDQLGKNQAICSAYAERVARTLMASDGELHHQAQAAGLLLDGGQAVMRCQFADLYREAERLVLEEGMTLSQAEKIILGVSHAELSSFIAAEAGLPDAVVEVIAYHHAPAACPNPHVALLLAIHIADVLAREGDQNEPPLDLEYVQFFGQVDDMNEWRKVAAGN